MLEILNGMLIVCIYFACLAASALIIRHFVKIPDELFRKILHFILLGSLLVFVFAFATWWSAALGCLFFVLIVYPILLLAEKIKNYSKIVTERKKGELKNSLIVVFTMFAIVISICWGLISDKFLVLTAVYAWGIGDAFAALIGKKFGKHKIYKNKSLEGSLSMFIASFLSVLIILSIRGLIPWYAVLIISIFASLTTTIIELFTPNGLDTITCPLGAMIVIIPLLILFGGLF